MKKQLSYAIALSSLALAPLVSAQAAPAQGTYVQPHQLVVTASMPSAQRSRAQVLAELACAQASGEVALLHGDAYDEVRAQAVRMRAARMAACDYKSPER